MSLKSSRKEKSEEVEGEKNHSETINVYHKKKVAEAHESLDYLPSHSEVYKTWLRENPHR